MENQRPDLSAIKRELPPFVSRTFPRFRELTGYSPRTVANLDAMGHGPAKKIRLGHAIAYERESLVAWLEERSSVVTGKQVES